MHLKSVKLTHFRGYRKTTVIPIDDAMTGMRALPSRRSHACAATF